MDTNLQNRKRLCGDRDETINRIIRECSKLAQKVYKIRYTWLDKVTYWKLYKKFNFDHMKKWYIRKPESVFENETHKLLWDFEI